jgi:pyrophosphatase PpaX
MDWALEPAMLEAMIATYRDYNISNHDAKVSAYPGVVETVRRVRQTGRRVGLVTSKTRIGAVRGLRFLGLEDQMELIVGVDDVANPKPHPEPVLSATTQLGVPPSETVYVGDSTHDMISGRAAGARTAAVLWGPFGREHLAPTAPDYWLERPENLLSVLEA